MKINVRGNKIEITEAIHDYIVNKLQRIEKYLDNSKESDAKVIVSVKGLKQKVEVTVWNGHYFVRAEDEQENLYVAIDLVLDKLEKQFRRYKDKLTAKRREDSSEPLLIDEDDIELEEKIVKRKEIYLKPIDEEEAITQMELLGHSFFVFKNVEDNKINVVYKRKDGDYGIIEAN